ncbi:Protein FAR1-RELATED SEQUENCE 8 [Bienertia sinuspersici]
MECDEVVGVDDAFDDVNVGNECDEVYDERSDVAREAGLDELHVGQCVGDSNIDISLGSASGYNMCDNGTQREDVTDTRNIDGVVTPTVGSVYNSWEEVERMFKVYGKKKGFGVIRGQSAYYGGTKNKSAMTMRCECYGCPDMKIKNDEKKRQKKYGDRGMQCLNREQLWEIRKVTLEHIGHIPKPEQAKLVKQYRMEHFIASMRSRVFNDIDAGVPAQIHPKFANGNPVGEIFPTYVHRCEVSAFQRECERLMHCNVKEEIPNGDHIYSYVIEDRVWKTVKGGIHEYLTPREGCIIVSTT